MPSSHSFFHVDCLPLPLSSVLPPHLSPFPPSPSPHLPQFPSSPSPPPQPTGEWVSVIDLSIHATTFLPMCVYVMLWYLIFCCCFFHFVHIHIFFRFFLVFLVFFLLFILYISPLFIFFSSSFYRGVVVVVVVIVMVS